MASFVLAKTNFVNYCSQSFPKNQLHDNKGKTKVGNLPCVSPHKYHMFYFPPTQFSRRFSENFFTSDILEYKRNINEGGCFNNAHVVYVLTVYNGKAEWTLERRYSQFFNFFVAVKERHGTKLNDLPNMPCKTYFPIVYDAACLSARKG